MRLVPEQGNFPIVKTSVLAFSYPSGRAFEFPDLSCLRGQHTLILGPSGTGKSTLLHLLAGILRGYSGSLKIDGQELGKLGNTEVDWFRGQHIGIVFQKPHFIPSLSILENIRLPLNLLGKGVDENYLQELLDHLGISSLTRKLPGAISAGEQQRAGIARALINRPSLILADEPTSALDDAHCDAVVELLRSQADFSGATLVIVTHDARLKHAFEHAVELKMST